MSLIPVGVTIIEAAALDLLSAVFFRVRSIGGFVANVTVEEKHTDELVISEFPVERGAAITDHSYKRPAKVLITAGWSNSSPQAGGDVNYVQRIYAALLALQASRVPFDIITGKRIYPSMLMERLYENTDEKTENSMLVECECREVFLTNTQTVTVPPSEVQKTPQLNAPVTLTGSQQAVSNPGNFNPGAVPQ